MKLKNTIIIIIVIIAIAVIAFFFYRRMKFKKLFEFYKSVEDELNRSDNYYSKLPEWNGKSSLIFGDENKAVYLLQSILNEKHEAKLTLNGKFDNNTKSALEKHYNKSKADLSVLSKIFLKK